MRQPKWKSLFISPRLPIFRLFVVKIKVMIKIKSMKGMTNSLPYRTWFHSKKSTPTEFKILRPFLSQENQLVHFEFRLNRGLFDEYVFFIAEPEKSTLFTMEKLQADEKSVQKIYELNSTEVKIFNRNPVYTNQWELYKWQFNADVTSSILAVQWVSVSLEAFAIARYCKYLPQIPNSLGQLTHSRLPIQFNFHKGWYCEDYSTTVLHCLECVAGQWSFIFNLTYHLVANGPKRIKGINHGWTIWPILGTNKIIK